MKTLITNFLYKQYHLRVDDYLHVNSKQWIVIIKPRLSRCKLKISIDEIVCHGNYLRKIHPYDCYIIGMLHSFILNDVTPENIPLLQIKHNNEKITPCVRFSGVCYNKDVLNFKLINSNDVHSITFDNFINNIFIVRGLSENDAFKLGFTITERLLCG